MSEKCDRASRQADMTEIIAGLLPGEVIAAKNSVVLEAQLAQEQPWSGVRLRRAVKHQQNRGIGDRSIGRRSHPLC